MRPFFPTSTIIAYPGSSAPRLISSVLRRWTRSAARSRRPAPRIARAPQLAWKCSKRLSRSAPLGVSPNSHAAVGRQHGPLEQPCSPICLRTRPTIVAKPSCSPANWVIRCRTEPPTASGVGRSFGSSAALAPARDDGALLPESVTSLPLTQLIFCGIILRVSPKYPRPRLHSTLLFSAACALFCTTAPPHLPCYQ